MQKCLGGGGGGTLSEVFAKFLGVNPLALEWDALMKGTADVGTVFIHNSHEGGDATNQLFASEWRVFEGEELEVEPKEKVTTFALRRPRR